jgi:hypothetical protein
MFYIIREDKTNGILFWDAKGKDWRINLDRATAYKTSNAAESVMTRRFKRLPYPIFRHAYAIVSADAIERDKKENPELWRKRLSYLFIIFFKGVK